MSLNEIAYSIAGRLNEPTNDVLIAEIKFQIAVWRAFLMRQEIERDGQSGMYTQTMTVPLVLVDAADNCYIDLDCKVLKTSVKVPNPINIKGDAPFNYVGAVNMKKPFGFRNQSTIAFSFTGKQVFYSVNNGYIYVWGNNKLDYLTISGIFENPEEAIELCIDSTNCVGDDENYPISGHHAKTIIEGLVSGIYPLRPLKNEVLTRDATEE